MIHNKTLNIDSNKRDKIILIDKPLDWTSFDVVKKIRTLYSIKKVGHAGTLDPKATGLLIICTGNKTKQINQYVGLEKEYIGTMQIGIRTPSFDTETDVIEIKDFSNVDEELAVNTAKLFIGKQLQTPPMYSALKYCGTPLYRYAREEKEVDRTKREIEIKKFEIEYFRKPYIDFRVICSKGTYIRALIDEYGLKLGCCATLISLRRVRIGDYNLDQSLTIKQLIELNKAS